METAREFIRAGADVNSFPEVPVLMAVDRGLTSLLPDLVAKGANLQVHIHPIYARVVCFESP